MYAGCWNFKTLKVSVAILNSIREETGSQWSLWSTGEMRWQCGCESFKVRLQCGDRNFEDIRRKNIITKIWYVDGFDWSYSFGKPWRHGFEWDQQSWQYCMMVRNERHWTFNRADHSRRSSSNKQIKSVACPVSWKGNMWSYYIMKATHEVWSCELILWSVECIMWSCYIMKSIL